MPNVPRFTRLPQVFQTEDVDNVLERYLSVHDSTFDKSHDKVDELLPLLNIDKIPDRYLRLYSDRVGHTWREAESYAWNRQRIKDSFHRYSYKGTTLAVKDLAKEYGSLVNYIQDNASKLLILGKQGRLSCDDAYMVSADYWHDGAFLAQFSSTGDTDGLILELPSITPAGQVWYIEFVFVSEATFYADAIIEFQGTLTFTNALEGTIGYGQLGQSLILSAQPGGDSDMNYLETVWGDLFSKPIGSVGYGILGESLFVSSNPAIAADCSFNEIGWHISTPEGSLGYSLLGSELFLSVQPAATPLNELDDLPVVDIGLSLTGEDSLEVSEASIETDFLGMFSEHHTWAEDITFAETNK